jgi:hypothetical protein
MSLRDRLHDRIDLREELADEARATVKRVVEANLTKVLEGTDEVADAMDQLAHLVAEALDALTTQAVRRGAKVRLAANAEAKRG